MEHTDAHLLCGVCALIKCFKYAGTQTHTHTYWYTLAKLDSRQFERIGVRLSENAGKNPNDLS